MTGGVNRFTGKPLEGFAHVKQSLGVIFTTRLTTRVLHRTFGSAVPKLLGQPVTPPTLIKWYMAIVIAVEHWEPRFRVTHISYPKDENSPVLINQGRFGIRITGQYRPNALEGDLTVASIETVTM